MGKKYINKLNKIKDLGDLAAAKLGKKVEDISLNSRLIEDLGADSLDIVDLLMSIEDEFEVEIPDEDVENLVTVGDVAAELEKLTK